MDPKFVLPQWSPDGSRIVFVGFVKSHHDIFWIGANGGTPQLLIDHPGNNSNPTWSRDGQWIYFFSDRSGRQEIWRMPAEGGEATQITRNGGWRALESWDGQWLYVMKRPYGSLWRISIGGGKEEQIVDAVQAFNFAVGSKGIYFMPGSDHRLRIQSNCWTRRRVNGEPSPQSTKGSSMALPFHRTSAGFCIPKRTRN